jgi:hypothetical protein
MGAPGPAGLTLAEASALPVQWWMLRLTGGGEGQALTASPAARPGRGFRGCTTRQHSDQEIDTQARKASAHLPCLPDLRENVA